MPMPKLSRSSSRPWQLGRTSRDPSRVSHSPFESAAPAPFWADSATATAPDHSWQVLGIPSEPIRDEIVKAFNSLNSRFHPNKQVSSVISTQRAVYIDDAVHEAYRWYQKNDGSLPERPGWKQVDAAGREQPKSPSTNSFWADTPDLLAPAEPYDCLGIASAADQATTQVVFEKLILTSERRTSYVEQRYRRKCIDKAFRKAYSSIRHSRAIQGGWSHPSEQVRALPNARTSSQPPPATFWWYEGGLG